jgi:hypothetical protein
MYEDWLDDYARLQRRPGDPPQFECRLVALPYEAAGLSEAQLADALQWVKQQQAVRACVRVRVCACARA